MAFNWEESAFLGYMVEQHERQQQQNSFDWDYDDTTDEEEEENNLPWWER